MTIKDLSVFCLLAIQKFILYLREYSLPKPTSQCRNIRRVVLKIIRRTRMEYMDKIRAVEVFNFIVNGNLNNHKTCLLHLPFAYST